MTGPRPSDARADRRRRLFIFFTIPALTAGVALVLITSGDDHPTPPDGLGLGSSNISAVPPVDRAPNGGAASAVRRVVTGGPGSVDPATEGDIAPVEARPAVPVRIAIPSVGVDATIVSVGATPDGIRVPPVYEAGWYEKGPRPSEPGRAIVLGHLDSLTGPAAFTQVPQAETGDDVIVTDELGLTHTFRVEHTVEVSKSDFPAEAIYGATSRPSIALITCGGDFDPKSGYENNVIVFARELRSD